MIRCREIATADIGAVADFLTRGYSRVKDLAGFYRESLGRKYLRGRSAPGLPICRIPNW